MAETCGAPTLEGTPCGQVVAAAGVLCIWHDPARAAEADAARARGQEGIRQGLAERQLRERNLDFPENPSSLADVIAWLSWLTGKVARDQIAVPRAKALADVLRAYREAVTTGKLEERLDELAARFDRLSGGTRKLKAVP